MSSHCSSAASDRFSDKASLSDFGTSTNIIQPSVLLSQILSVFATNQRDTSMPPKIDKVSTITKSNGNPTGKKGKTKKGAKKDPKQSWAKLSKKTNAVLPIAETKDKKKKKSKTGGDKTQVTTTRRRMNQSKWSRFVEILSCCRCTMATSIDDSNAQQLFERVNSGHLDMEPLCCSSSCFVRAACKGVVVFNYCIIITISILLFLRIVSTKTFWEPFVTDFPQMLYHPIFIYVLAGFCGIWAYYMVLLYIAVNGFNSKRLTVPYRFQYFLAIMAGLISLIILIVMILDEKARKDLTTVTLLGCFLCVTAVEIWAITVIKECFNFFNLCGVLVSMAGGNI